MQFTLVIAKKTFVVKLYARHLQFHSNQPKKRVRQRERVKYERNG